MQTFTSDIQAFDKIDYVVDILEFDINKVPFVPDVIWASPPCTYFSVASIGKHWNKDHSPKTQEAMLGVRIVQETLDIIECFLNINPYLKFFIENPRGKLRKLDVIKDFDRATVWYCKYGDTRAKPTDIWTNHLYNIYNGEGWKPRPVCSNGNKDCHHEKAPRGSNSGTQGLKGNYLRSMIPVELCQEIINSVKCMQKNLTGM